MPKLSIVIPAYNEENYIERCLESINRLDRRKIQEVIVVDNGSTDRTGAIASSYSWVTLVREPHKGLMYARQRGLLTAHSTLVAFVDADTELPEHWIDIIESAFANSPDLICLSGPFYYYDAQPIQNLLVWIHWNIFARIIYPLVGYMAAAGNMAVCRDAFRAIGGFNTSISFYGDDTDSVRRLNEVGVTKFDFQFSLQSSARRLRAEGILRVGFIYTLNYFSEIFFNNPATKVYRDIR